MLARLRFAWPVIFCCGCPASSPVARAPLDSGAGGARPSGAATGVRYALPACPLSYEVLVREKSDLDGAGFDTERFMTLEATAQNGRMRLDAVVDRRAARRVQAGRRAGVQDGEDVPRDVRGDRERACSSRARRIDAPDDLRAGRAGETCSTRGGDGRRQDAPGPGVRRTCRPVDRPGPDGRGTCDACRGRTSHRAADAGSPPVTLRP
jgi:hypothetical protein